MDERWNDDQWYFFRVFREQPRGLVLVSRGDRIDQGPMLARDLFERPEHVAVQSQQRAKRRDVPVEHLDDAGVA